jgi:hypothetical protein
MKISLILRCILFPFLGLLAAAQVGPTQSTYSLLVNVLDRNGNAIRDLTKDSFRIEVHGHHADVVKANYSLAPRRMVVLLDVSGSMEEEKGSEKWQIARAALEDLVAETPRDVPIALLPFSDQVYDVLDFSQNRESITKWLKQEPSHKGPKQFRGATALFDAIAAAAKLLEPPRPGDAIYAITDGGNNKSHISGAAIEKQLLRSEVRFFVFLLAEPSLSEEERSGKESVFEIIRTTGGYGFGVTSYRGLGDLDPMRGSMFRYEYDRQTRERIELSTKALNVQVNGFYTLELVTPPGHWKTANVSVKVVDGAGQPRKGVVLAYPRELFTKSK